ncbi:MAG TPA: ribose-5-phosphate isomerase RpiA [Dongiaceae bacterium]|nr:ribose-5-phosphate isomerase RpiA [Dongiaceae bacterium]
MKSSDPALVPLKRKAAERAVAEVEDKMVLGLGSGSTAALMVEAVARRVAAGLKVVGIPTSEATAALARRLGVPLTDFEHNRRIDLTIDGADQIERGTLNLVKGLGGALLREKIVAEASARMIVIADGSKLVAKLGAATPLPVEIVPFGWPLVLDRLKALHAECALRREGDVPFVTNGGNYVADCRFNTIEDAALLQAQLKAITGVVETGLFVGLATQAMIGREAGVEVLEAA